MCVSHCLCIVYALNAFIKISWIIHRIEENLLVKMKIWKTIHYHYEGKHTSRLTIRNEMKKKTDVEARNRWLTMNECDDRYASSRLDVVAFYLAFIEIGLHRKQENRMVCVCVKCLWNDFFLFGVTRTTDSNQWQMFIYRKNKTCVFSIIQSSVFFCFTICQLISSILGISSFCGTDYELLCLLCLCTHVYNVVQFIFSFFVYVAFWSFFFFLTKPSENIGFGLSHGIT